MLIKQLDFAHNDDFVMNHPFGHHKKTSLWAQAQHEHMPFKECIGFYQDDTLVASALIFAKRTLFGRWWYIPYGPCVDYLDNALTKNVMESLHEYARSKNISLLQFEVNVPRIEHDQKGDLLVGGFNHEFVTQTIKQSGFHHLGYNYGYSGNIQPRFTYILNLSDDLKTLHKNMQKSIMATQKKNVRRHVTVEVADASKLEVLVQFGQELSDENDFSAKGLTHFQDIMEVYQEHALYCVASMDVSKAIQTIEQEIDKANQEIDKHSANAKKEAFVKEMHSLVEALAKEKEALLLLYPNQGNVYLGAGLYVTMKHHSYDLYMYTTKKITNLSPSIAIHLKAIELLKEQGIIHHDFVGISGSIEPSDPYYGLYDFKRKFGGDFIEYLGQFEGYLKPRQAKLIRNLHFQKRRIERKVIRIIKQIKRKKTL